MVSTLWVIRPIQPWSYTEYNYVMITQGGVNVSMAAWQVIVRECPHWLDLMDGGELYCAPFETETQGVVLKVIYGESFGFEDFADGLKEILEALDVGQRE